MRDYGIPEGMPTLDEIWAKLTGNISTYETDKVYTETILIDFPNAKDSVMQQKFRRSR